MEKIEKLFWDYMLGEIKLGRLTERYVAQRAKEAKFNGR